MMLNSSEVIDRLLKMLDIGSDTELSKKLGVSKSTISIWRSRNKLPYEQCVEFAKIKQVSLDWLLTGEGPMYRQATAGMGSMKAANDAQDLTQEEKVMLELFRSLPRTEQEEVTRLARKEKELAEMQERVAKLERKTA